MAFPAVMATAFSGFYLALYLVLWCLLLRGIALEFGGHVADGMWRSWWDTVFAGASLLLALLFGVAFGNLIRGLPLDGKEGFALSLFTDFTPYGRVGILDWYTVSVGLLTVVLLMAHGTSYLAMRTSHRVHERSRMAGLWLWPLSGILLVLVTAETWLVRRELYTAAAQRPLVWVATAVVAGGVAYMAMGGRRRRDAVSVLGSTLIIVGLLGGAFAVIYPEMLHSSLKSGFSMTAHISAADAPSLVVALVWWPVSVIAAIIYAVINLRSYRDRVGPGDDTADPDGQDRPSGR
jgi:cytochrome d ubiquinol oxidase subunit II